jgi:ribonuclease R
MARKPIRSTHTDAIQKVLSGWTGALPRPRKLARIMGIDDAEYREFRRAYDRVMALGLAASAASEPGARRAGQAAAKPMVGRFKANPRGFGFVTPEPPDGSDDVFIPARMTGGAMSGDLVEIKPLPRSRHERAHHRAGEVIEVLERGTHRVVGTLERASGAGLVHPEGKDFDTPVLVLDLDRKVPDGARVVVDIVEFPRVGGTMPLGEVREVLGSPGALEVETLSVIRAHGLPDRSSDAALAEARAAADTYRPEDVLPGREDLSGVVVITIDPPDARDFDDAISLEPSGDGTATLGVHIADVAHFVREGSCLDLEARERGNSAYFPRRVVPMLPEPLSAGVCCLKPGEPRLALSIFLTFDASGHVVRTRMARSVVRSRHRLTYEAAQRICDGATEGCTDEVVRLVREMEGLARRIADRRRRAGMLHLDLPEVSLVLAPDGTVRDAVPAGREFSHTIIEMFMIEANEAVASLFAGLGVPLVRRIHPPPDDESYSLVRALARSADHRLPDGALGRNDLQRLLDDVTGRPEGYAVNLALLRSLQQARYSTDLEGHFALASTHYCHFTSPIRRYPDLLVHRLLTAHLRGQPLPTDGADDLEALAEHLSMTERRAEAAELELRHVLVLRYLSTRIGERFAGVVTGVTDFGVFVQSPRFLVEGLLRLEDLGTPEPRVDPESGTVRSRAGRATIRLGMELEVVIARVDVARRHLDLALAPGGRGRTTARPRRTRDQARQPRRVPRTRRDRG